MTDIQGCCPTCKDAESSALNVIRLETALHLIRFSLDRFIRADFKPAPEYLRELLDRVTDDPGEPCDRDQQYARAKAAEAALARVTAFLADIDTPDWRAPGTEVALRIRSLIIDRGDDETPRLLDCGFCYEEQGEEVHPHPECPIGVRTEKQGGPVVGTARIALDAAIVPSSWTATESNGSARQELFSLACQDMPVDPSAVTEAIRAADVELAATLKSYADGRRSSHGELWYDAILEMAVYIANLPPVVAP